MGTKMHGLVLVASFILALLAVSGCKRENPEPSSSSALESAAPETPAEAKAEVTEPDEAEPEGKQVTETDEQRRQRQENEVRKVFAALQEACKTNDIEACLDFFDYQTKQAIDGRDLDLDQRRQRRRDSLTKTPALLQEIASMKLESVAVNTKEAEKVATLHGTEIEGTMMLVRTDGRALLFHETDQGWKWWNIAPAEYYR